MNFEILTEDALARDPQFWDILESSLPLEERESRDVLWHCFRQSDVYFVRARVDGQTVGIATFQILKKLPSLFLGYLATDAQQRSRGIGTALLDFCWTTGLAIAEHLDLPLIGMVTEVDTPLLSESGNPSMAGKRLGFYQKNGFIPLPSPYFQPSLSSAPPPPMQLLFKPRDQRTALLERSLQSDLTQALYTEKYAAHNGIAAIDLADLLARTSL